MAKGQDDYFLANGFTRTIHTHANAAIDPSKNKLPTGLNVLVVGASRGIGEGIAYAYAQAGAANLILAARASSSKEVSAVAEKAKTLNPSVSVTSLHVDITDSSSVAALAQDVKEKFGHLDVLVLNSGLAGALILDITTGDPQDFKKCFDVNVQGTYLIAHHLLPLVKESKGPKLFIVVSTFASLITGGPFAHTAYCVSKLAQARIVEFIAEQFGDEGLVAVAVHPGAVTTEATTESCDEETLKNFTDDVGLCGAFCVWLSREKRSWLNGKLTSAKWDVDELLEHKGKIESEGLLKLTYKLYVSAARFPEFQDSIQGSVKKTVT